MRIKTLTFRNIKLLEDQTFTFARDDGTPRDWTVLLGENGVCKTTILQAIAMASSGDRMTRALVEDAADYVDATRSDREARIEATFQMSDGGDLELSLSVEPGSHVFVGGAGTDRLNAIRDKREPGHLVVGYGVGRRLPKRGEVAVPRDPLADRVEGLFDTHHKMLGVDFFEALRDREEGLGLRFAEAVGRVLLTEDAQGDRLLPWLLHVERRGHAGVDEMRKLLESRRLVIDVGREAPVKLAPHLLSQGYQSTFAWVADLLGHAFLDAGRPVEPADMTGIVLLDELDLHLHPRWQRRLVPLLRRVFPRLQFVVTTHSPLVLTGFEAEEIVGLGLEDGFVRARRFDREPAMQSSTELMAEYFDVTSSTRPELEVKQTKLLSLLASDARTTEDDELLVGLEAELEPYLASTELADLPSPDSIEAEAKVADPGQWERDLRALKRGKRAARPPAADEEADLEKKAGG